MSDTGNKMSNPNPVFLMLAELARMTYGEALIYQGDTKYDDRAEAAVALCEANAVRIRPTRRHPQTGRVMAWVYVVVSQSSRKRHYIVSADGTPECECEDWQRRMRLVRAELERAGKKAITVPAPTPCKHLLCLMWMLALQVALPHIELEEEVAEQSAPQPAPQVPPVAAPDYPKPTFGKSVRYPLDDPELEELCGMMSANNYDHDLDKKR